MTTSNQDGVLQTEPVSRKKITVEIAGAAVFIALSAALAGILVPVIPRLIWGIAIVDPVSIVWITCFLLFGWRSGLICTIGGTLLLFPFDPTGIGPIFKFLATFPLVMIPTTFYLINKRKKRDCIDNCEQWVLNPKHYTLTMLIAVGTRVALMVLVNYLYAVALGYLSFLSLEELGMPQITGIDALTIGVVAINLWQSLLDTAIPYLLVYMLKRNNIIL